ncbi:hypothetical protein Fmac_018801 [Flemingia macrophylla]|uniref:Uncharacterized protein n=1 Tax=Flemingia macrophylla TaxID=520843 RepID=A0ABD1M819_9FABA
MQCQLHKLLSNRCSMRLEPRWPLHHMNSFPRVGICVSLRDSVNKRKSLQDKLRGQSPPLFSCAPKTALKSPMKTHEPAKLQ